MTEARQIRAENYAAKRASGFSCEECGAHDQLLAVTATDRDDPFVLCIRHVEAADGRSVKVRPHQWDEAQRTRERLERERR